jgi:hypothetical protein
MSLVFSQASKDGLEPRMVLYLKVTALLLFLEDDLEPRMVFYLKVTALLFLVDGWNQECYFTPRSFIFS